MTGAQKALVKKDFKEVWGEKMVRTTLILLPILMAVVFPAIYVVIALTSGSADPSDLEELPLPAGLTFDNISQAMYYFFMNSVTPLLFLMIPVMSSVVTAANSFTGEKERGTMETLLLTPMTVNQIYVAKITGCLLISGLVTAISFTAFCVVAFIGGFLLNMGGFLSINWLFFMLLLAPAVTLLGVVTMVWVSGKARTFMEAQQKSMFVVLPLLLLFMGSMSGLFTLNGWILSAVSLVIFVVDYFLVKNGLRKFTPEQLLNVQH